MVSTGVYICGEFVSWTRGQLAEHMGWGMENGKKRGSI